MLKRVPDQLEKHHSQVKNRGKMLDTMLIKSEMKVLELFSLMIFVFKHLKDSHLG